MMDRNLAAGPRYGNARRGAVLLALLPLLALTMLWAMTVGSSPMPTGQVLAALLHPDGSREHLVVVGLRLPRVLAGSLVGAALAMAGAIMQAVTNNPLASPGLLGINAGASFSVVLAIAFLEPAASATYIWFAFAGAAAAAFAVYSLGSIGSGGATPLKLALAGAVLATFLSSLTTAALIFGQGTLDDIRLWLTGSLTGTTLGDVASVAPFILAGLLAASLFCGQIMTLSLGSEIARSVGQNLVLWRSLSAVIVVLLAGSAVALAGPIGFVGLVVPHVARLLVGVDYRWIIPFSALGGGLLVVAADALVRALFAMQDMPVGVTMAVIGAPFFIYLARYRIDRLQ
jgi:iron complex transport system permease protein